MLENLIDSLNVAVKETGKHLDSALLKLNKLGGIYAKNEDHDCNLVGGHGEDSCSHVSHERELSESKWF